MSKYIVQASLGTKHGAVIFSADDDSGAMLRAIEIILEHATWDTTWAKGRITLTDPNDKVIQTMDAKPDTDRKPNLPTFSRLFGSMSGL